ncbi:MAG TPA: TlpA disulfide reductase family protein [Acidimicrobiales bacterium]|nr:TlpA disulfide reductase family protein [Acidimicrobiales bacterium]
MSTPAAPRTRSSSAARAARAGEGSHRTWIFVGVGLVVVFAAILAVALATEETSSTAAVAEVTVTGDPLPLFTEPTDDPAIGLPAPALSGTGIDDEPLEITPGDGTAKVITFFAHWCPVCQTEVPLLVDLLDEGGLPDDVELVAVSTGVDPARGNYPPGAWFAREGWEEPTLVDDTQSPAGRAFGLSAYPYYVAVDAEGNVVQRSSGAISMEQVQQLAAAAAAG